MVSVSPATIDNTALAVPVVCSSFNDHLQRARIGRVREGIVGIVNAVELKSMSNQTFRFELVRAQSVEQHWRTNRVDQPRGDRNIPVP